MINNASLTVANQTEKIHTFSEKQLRNFWKKVFKINEIISPHVDTPCWIWTGCRFRQGYGSFKYGLKMVSAHRLSWTIHNGEIPERFDVLHKCDNPSCVNPNHLKLGTHTDNMRDMIEKNRWSPCNGINHYLKLHPEKRLKGEKNPRSKLTEENVRSIRKLLTEGNTQRGVAAIFGVKQSAIFEIANKKTWAHII